MNEKILSRVDRLVQPGDFFVTFSDDWFSRPINFFQRIKSPDGEAKYAHAGFFTSWRGTSYEALWTVGTKDFFAEHAGQYVCIGRHKAITPEKASLGIQRIRSFYGEGKLYPAYRLLFMLLPGLAKYAPFGRGVCSEITAHFLELCGFWRYYTGVTPDNIYDWMSDPWNTWVDILYRGKVKEEDE